MDFDCLRWKCAAPLYLHAPRLCRTGMVNDVSDILLMCELARL